MLDQFYTERETARRCWLELEQALDELGVKSHAPFFVEPSAGDGAFYDLLPPDRRVGFDIEPRHPEVQEKDFLFYFDYRPPTGREHTVIVGNPPFGDRGRLAVQFFWQAAELSDTIAFIVPVIFRKYFIHKQLPSGFRWIRSLPLSLDSFRTPDGKTFSVNTEFQIWTKLACSAEDRRLFEPPSIRHPDFTMWQYNNTKQALGVFENEFEFAVPCQGWQDYSRRVTDPDECEKHKQWMLFKSDSEVVLRRLYAIDYGELALRNTTSVPGFRKGDLVKEYTRLYGKQPTTRATHGSTGF